LSPPTVSTKLAQIAKQSAPGWVLMGSNSHVALWSRYPQGHLSGHGRVLTNRMSELLTYGSVGGAGRKPGPYPAGQRRSSLLVRFQCPWPGVPERERWPKPPHDTH